MPSIMTELNPVKINADLVELMRSWKEYLPGLQLLCFYDLKRERIVLELISVPTLNRRHGICGQVIDELTDIARGHGVEIWLKPDDVFGVSKQVLSKIYSGYGFSWVGSDGEWMRKV